jgi:hypothetical protein
MKQCLMLDINALLMLLERRSPQLDQWFSEERCSFPAIVAAELQRLGITLAAMDLLIASHGPAG